MKQEGPPKTLLPLALLNDSVAQSWQQKPAREWSAEDVSKVLIDSPWVSLFSAGFGTKSSSPRKKLHHGYRIRLLTAEPVRYAYLLVIDAGPKLTNLIGVEYPNKKKISVSDLSKPGRLKRFLEENPDDIRIKGSKEFIVLSVVEVW